MRPPCAPGVGCLNLDGVFTDRPERDTAATSGGGGGLSVFGFRWPDGRFGLPYLAVDLGTAAAPLPPPKTACQYAFERGRSLRVSADVLSRFSRERNSLSFLSESSRSRL